MAIEEIKLFDILGKQQSADWSSTLQNSYSVDLQALPPGIYLLHIQLESGLQISKKLVKE